MNGNQISEAEKSRVRQKAAEFGLESLTLQEKAVHREVFWENTGGTVESRKEQVILPSLKGVNHKWEIENAAERSIVCVSCPTPHGHILHPPNEWNLVEGKLLHLEKGKWNEWVY